MPWSESLPQFSLAGTLLTVLLLFFAAFGEPLLGRRAFSWLSRRRDGDERALGLLYAVTMAIHVLWGLLVLVVLLLSPELNLVDLGLRTPDAFGPIVGAAVGGLIALAAFWVLVNGLPTKERFPILAKLPEREAKKDAETEDEAEDGSGGRGRRRGSRGSGHRGRRVASAKPMTLPEPGRQQYLLLPRTRRERGMATGMAVTGGVFGELLYRGLFITLVASMGVPLWVAAVMSVLLFSVAHAYQGWWGLLSAGFSGTLFTVLYLGTGSLVVPVLVHVALNLRSVVFPPAADRAAAEEAYYSDDGYYDDEYEDDYGRTGEFEAVEAPGGREGGGEPSAAPQGSQGHPRPGGTPPFGTPAPQGHPGTQGHQGTPGHQGTQDHQGPQGPQGPPPPPQHRSPQGPPPGYGPQGPFPSGPPTQGPPAVQGPPAPQGPPPPPHQPPRHRPPQGPPQGPPRGYGPQGPVPPARLRPQAPPANPYPPAPPVPPAQPAHDPGDSLSGPGHSGDPLSGPYPGHGGEQDGRRMYPDEWIDRHHGPEGDTPGPGSPYRD